MAIVGFQEREKVGAKLQVLEPARAEVSGMYRGVFGPAASIVEPVATFSGRGALPQAPPETCLALTASECAG